MKMIKSRFCFFSHTIYDTKKIAYFYSSLQHSPEKNLGDAYPIVRSFVKPIYGKKIRKECFFLSFTLVRLFIVLCY